MNILLGITGSIANILHNKLIQNLSQFGTVKVVTTANAGKITDIESYSDEDEYFYFHKELSGHDLTGKKLSGLKQSDVLHVDLRDWADILVVAPLTANTMAKFTHGLADNLLTNIFRCWNFDKRVIVAPTMNTQMWNNPLTKTQLNTLIMLGVTIIQPQVKLLRCGDYGIGAMGDIQDIIRELQPKWKFPLANCNGIPINYHPGAYGFQRKNSNHTGIDLYCAENDLVYAVEDGEITGIEKFTGPSDNSPWWLDTECVLVYGNSGTVCYGEIKPAIKPIQIGTRIKQGTIIGSVTPVLPPNRFRPDIPGHSTSMLHLELYEGRQTKASISWLDAKKKFLRDPTPYLLNFGYKLLLYNDLY